MTQNIYWFTPDAKEAWAYGGRLYRSESKAMQEYNKCVSRLETSIITIETYIADPKETYYYGKPEILEQYKENLEKTISIKPRHFKIVWDE